MASWPTTPEPPVRLTTLMGCLSSFSISEAMMRAVASVPPPAPQGTISWIGRCGYCACAAPTTNAAHNAAIFSRTRMDSSWINRMVTGILPLQAQQLDPFVHLLAGLEMELRHAPIVRRRNGVLHFHRFEDHQWGALGDLRALGHQYLQHLARHRRGEGADGGVRLGRALRALQRQHAVRAVAEEVPIGAVAHCAHAECGFAQSHLQRAVCFGARERLFAPVSGEAQACRCEMNRHVMTLSAVREH